MNWPLFVSVFSLIFVAELPDKTAFATLLMATRGRPIAIFSGVALAFLLQTLVAVSFGHVISLFPERWVHFGAGLLFIAFAALTWFAVEKDEEPNHDQDAAGDGHFIKLAWKAFIVIFVAEWGDLTQLATASMAARYHGEALTVFVAAVLALWSVTSVAVVLGNRVKGLIAASRLKLVSAAAFAAVGVYFISTAL